ncbi:MAG TPA: enolase C-terminal domain-like protein [Candidatus Binatia bacterium]|nr:enolase C-terminal domain-like protein [Candidatus Binatia bacterium]
MTTADAKNNDAAIEAPFKIEKVQSWRATLRRAIAWKTARYTKGDIEATVVGVTDEAGNTGYGYMPAMLIVGESPVTAEALLHTAIAPLLKEQVLGVPDVMKKIDFAVGANFQLKFAVEEALLDLQAKRMKTPLCNLFGGLSRRDVPVMRMLGLKPPKETAGEAQALVERGYRYVKIKIGLDDKRDIETVKITRQTLGDDVFISVDANQSYAPMRAVKVLNELESCNLIVCEQPVRRDDVRGMAFVRQNVRTPIMADEGVETAVDALRLIDAGGMDAVSIKLWKMGGYYKSREIAAVCSAANVGVHVGSTAGSQLMEAMQLHFCATIPDLFAGAEIGEFESLNEDPASGLNVIDGKLSVTNRPGLGVEIDMNKLQETTAFWQPK